MTKTERIIQNDMLEALEAIDCLLVTRFWLLHDDACLDLVSRIAWAEIECKIKSAIVRATEDAP